MASRNAAGHGQQTQPGQTPVAADITQQDFRQLLTSLTKMVTLIADGQVTVDGQAVGTGGAREAQEARTSSTHPTRPTIRELRAQAQERAVAMGLGRPATHPPSPQVFIDVSSPAVVPKHALPKDPRVVYELAVKDKRIDASGITPAGVAILKHLVTHHEASIKDFMTTLNLKRSTIANVLTALKKRGLVASRLIKED